MKYLRRRVLRGFGMGLLVVALGGLADDVRGQVHQSAAGADPAPGVSLTLARQRKALVEDLRYEVGFAVPGGRDSAVTGTVTIRFRLVRPADVVLDFRAPSANVGPVTANGRPTRPRLTPDHVTIPRAATRPGENAVEVSFTSNDAALNRRDDFFYALFVPDRASTVFPCFDQPDLKGQYRLTLRLPTGWLAVANGSETARTDSGGATTVRFAETAPISSYLFSFAGGVLQRETAVRNGRTFTFYHRETDSAKVARNRDAIFDLHAAAIEWLERYTGIPYPFEKFAFFAVPSFQFGGMEHPGAVWYNASGLFLERAATRNQLLGRASVIAHETAHMWFGDLVTMRWFNDVWMKEVFANFMAAKIVGPQFPDVNQQLRFYLAHLPTAYAVDRTAGTNPIRQRLDNLRDAGSLYGAIIYQKAPVVMQQLERAIGEAAMQAGLREYLDGHRFGNADWNDLITILDRKTPDDLAAWSRIWVEDGGRPAVRIDRPSPRRLTIRQLDPSGRGRQWPERVSFTAVGPDSTVTRTLSLGRGLVTLELPFEPSLVIGGTDGVGYGRFLLDQATIARLPRAIPSLGDPVVRSVAWQSLFEAMIGGRLPADSLIAAGLAALATERDPLIAQQVLGLLQTTYWRYLRPARRIAWAGPLEHELWESVGRAAESEQKAAFFNTLVSVSLTAGGVGKLEQIWRQVDSIPGLPLEEPQLTALAEALALRQVEGYATILDEQERRISNPDRLARFRFVRGAFLPSIAQRDSVFDSFRDLANRRRESWVLETMGYLNHPLRVAESIRYLGPSLELLETVKETGDIFFPTGWVNAALDGHQSAAAAETVARFLARHPKYPARLRGKLLQAADGLFRAAVLLDGWKAPAGLLAEPPG